MPMKTDIHACLSAGVISTVDSALRRNDEENAKSFLLSECHAGTDALSRHD